MAPHGALWRSLALVAIVLAAGAHADPATFSYPVGANPVGAHGATASLTLDVGACTDGRGNATGTVTFPTISATPVTDMAFAVDCNALAAGTGAMWKATKAGFAATWNLPLGGPALPLTDCALQFDNVLDGGVDRSLVTVTCSLGSELQLIATYPAIGNPNIVAKLKTSASISLTNLIGRVSVFADALPGGDIVDSVLGKVFSGISGAVDVTIDPRGPYIIAKSVFTAFGQAGATLDLYLGKFPTENGPIQGATAIFRLPTTGADIPSILKPVFDLSLDEARVYLSKTAVRVLINGTATDVDAGVSFVGILSPTGTSLTGLLGQLGGSDFNKQLQASKITVKGVIASTVTQKFVAELAGNFDVAKGVTIKKLSFEVESTAAPPSIKFGFGATLDVIFSKGSANEKLVTFEGKITIGVLPEGVSLDFAFSANSATPWNNPLGISDRVSIVFPLVLKMGILITPSPPFLVPKSFGVAGGIMIGTNNATATRADVAFAADLTDPTKDVIKVDGKNIKFSSMVQNIAGCDNCLGFFAQVMDSYMSFGSISVSFNPSGEPVNVGTGSAQIIVQPGLLIDITDMKVYFVFNVRRAILKASKGGVEALVDMAPVDFAGILTIKKYTGPAAARRAIEAEDPASASLFRWSELAGSACALLDAPAAVPMESAQDAVGPEHVQELPRSRRRASARRKGREDDLPPFAEVILQSTPSVYLRFESSDGGVLVNSGTAPARNYTASMPLELDEGYLGNGAILAPTATVPFSISSLSDGHPTFSEFSVEAWVYFSPDNAAIKESLVIYESAPFVASAPRADRIRVSVTTRASIAVELSETEDFVETRALTVDTGDWVYVAVVVSLSSIRVYINGFASATSERLAVIPLYGGAAKLGPYWGEGTPDPVVVDEYAVYAHALSHEEVWAHYQAFDGADAYSWAVASQLPSVYQRFDSLDTAPDAGASDFGSGKAQPNTDFDDGLIGDALSLSTAAASGYTVPPGFLNGAQLTVEMWVKADANMSWANAPSPVLLLDGQDSPYFQGAKIAIAISQKGTLMARVGDMALFDFEGRTIDPDTWTYVALTVGETEVNGFLDGANVGSFPWTPAPVLLGPFAVGCSSDTDCVGTFVGLIDELVLYPSELSDEAIFSHYALLSPPFEAQLSGAILRDSPDVYLRFEDAGDADLLNEGNEEYSVTPNSETLKTGNDSAPIPGVRGTAAIGTVMGPLFSAVTGEQSDACTSDGIAFEFWGRDFDLAKINGIVLWGTLFRGDNYAFGMDSGKLSLSGGMNAQIDVAEATRAALPRDGDGVEYTHFALTCSKERLTLMVDGNIIATAPVASGGSSSKFISHYISFGTTVESTTPTLTAVDEFAFYRTALSPARLYNHYVRGRFGAKSRGVAISNLDPLVFFRFESTSSLSNYGSLPLPAIDLASSDAVVVGQPSGPLPDDGITQEAMTSARFWGNPLPVPGTANAGRFEALTVDIAFRLFELPCVPGHMTLFAGHFGGAWTHTGAVSLEVMYANKKAWLRATAVGAGQVDMFEVQKDAVYELTLIFDEGGVSVYGFVPVIGITLVHRSLWEPSIDPFTFTIDGLHLGGSPAGQSLNDMGLYGEISLFAVYGDALTEDDLVPRNWQGATVDAGDEGDGMDDGTDGGVERREALSVFAYYERSYSADEDYLDASVQRRDDPAPVDGPQLAIKFTPTDQYFRVNGQVTLLKTIDARLVLDVRQTELYGEAGFRLGNLFSLTFFLRSTGFPGSDGFKFTLNGTFEQNVWAELKKAGVAVAQQFAEAATQQLDSAKNSIGNAKAKLDEAKAAVERERQRVQQKFTDAQNDIRSKRDSLSSLQASCDDYCDNCKWYKPWNCIACAGCHIALAVAKAALAIAEAVVGAVSAVVDAAFQLAQGGLSAAQGALDAAQRVLDGALAVVNALPGLIDGLLSFLSKVFDVRRCSLSTTVTNSADTIGFEIDMTILGKDITLRGQLTLSFEGIKNWIVDQIRAALSAIGGSKSRRSIDGAFGGFEVTAEMLHAHGVVDMTRHPHFGVHRRATNVIDTVVACAAGMTVFDGSSQLLSGTVPTCLFVLPTLRSLYLTNNMLSGAVGPTLSLPALEYLGLAKNALTGPIPTSIQGSTRLKWLDVSDNPGIEGTLNVLEPLAALEYVNIRGTGIAFSEGGVVRALGKIPHLRYYDVTGIADPTNSMVSASAPLAVEITIVAETPQISYCAACSLVVKQDGSCPRECGADSLALAKTVEFIRRKGKATAEQTVTVTNTFAVGSEYTLIKATVTGVDSAHMDGWINAFGDVPSTEEGHSGIRPYYYAARPKCAAGLHGKDCSFFCPYSWQLYGSAASSMSQQMVEDTGVDESVRIMLEALSPRCFVPDIEACTKNVTLATQDALDTCIAYAEGTAPIARCKDAIDYATSLASDMGVDAACASTPLSSFVARLDSIPAVTCPIARFSADLFDTAGKKVGVATIGYARGTGGLSFSVEASSGDFVDVAGVAEDDACGLFDFAGTDDDGDDVSAVEILEGTAGYPGATLASWTNSGNANNGNRRAATTGGHALSFLADRSGVCLSAMWQDSDISEDADDFLADLKSTTDASSIFQYQFVVKTRGNPDGAYAGTLKFAGCGGSNPTCGNVCVSARACSTNNGGCKRTETCEDRLPTARAGDLTTTAVCNCLDPAASNSSCAGVGFVAPLTDGSVVACGAFSNSKCMVSTNGGRSWAVSGERVAGDRAAIVGAVASATGPKVLYATSGTIGRPAGAPSTSADRCLLLVDAGADVHADEQLVPPGYKRHVPGTRQFLESMTASVDKGDAPPTAIDVTDTAGQHSTIGISPRGVLWKMGDAWRMRGAWVCGEEDTPSCPSTA